LDDFESLGNFIGQTDFLIDGLNFGESSFDLLEFLIVSSSDTSLSDLLGSSDCRLGSCFQLFDDGIPVVETFPARFAVWYGSSESTETLVTLASTGAIDAGTLSGDTVALTGSGTDRVASASVTLSVGFTVESISTIVTSTSSETIVTLALSGELVA